jgi:type III restriction enzyme
MRYTLKDYQRDAVREVLARLQRARRGYQDYGALSQFALAATTGAGKTVMAAAVIETLFSGSDEFSQFEPDPGATVLWFSDDPSLNEQSRARIHSAASELDGRLVPVETTFAEETFAPGMVYFLNAQKLREGARLVRGASSPANAGTAVMAAPDMRQRSIYDVIRNTVQTPGRTLYFILDEAHRGMKNTRERQSIVQRLINGTDQAPAMPIVFGISATVDRFTQAMAQIKDRDTLPSVEVDAALVQASGLLKDDIVLVIPEEAGAFDTTLLRDAVRRIRRSTAAWETYSREQGFPDAVAPLLVVQVADKPTDDHLRTVVDVIHTEWPGLRPENIAHVFGTHKDLDLGSQKVEYIAPQRVQDQRRIRVLLAMEAISTGWDCPRAEVLVSFRTRNDATYVHQLLGRMMRTPLARRIPGNEVLNSIDCVLPHFDKKTSTEIATMLMKGKTHMDDDGDERGGGERRVLFDPVELTPNPAVPDAVWELFDELPSVTIPTAHAQPISRLEKLALALSFDGVRKDAHREATDKMCRVLDGRRVQYEEDVATAQQDVLVLSAAQLRGRLGRKSVSSTQLQLSADPRAIHESYKAAARALTGWLASAYVARVAPPEDPDADLIEAETLVAALGRTEQIVSAVESEANALVKAWLTEHRVAVKGLTDERQAVYDAIAGESVEPERIHLARPRVAQADRQARETDGTETVLPTRAMHLMAAQDGTVPVDLNAWERHVLDTEAARDSFAGWYRNPARNTKESLAVAYKDGAGAWKALRPDFVFFHRNADGTVVADLVDPHGHHLADALPKLRGLADFAEEHGGGFRRIESVALTDGEYRVLDLTSAAVREAVREAADAKTLYLSEHATGY